MTASTEQSRRDKILNAAENAFANFGFDGASLRHIVLEAGVNLATVYYYFGSKDGLMEAVLKRRLGPLRDEHLNLLKGYEEAAKGKPLKIEKVLEAMLLPPLRLAMDPGETRHAVTKLLGRIVTEPNAQTQELLRSQHEEVRTAFFNAFHRSLPKLPSAELGQRLEFVWGALAFILCNPRKIAQESGEVSHPANTTKVVLEMIRFFSAGFRAPAVWTPECPSKAQQPS